MVTQVLMDNFLQHITQRREIFSLLAGSPRSILHLCFCSHKLWLKIRNTKITDFFPFVLGTVFIDDVTPTYHVISVSHCSTRALPVGGIRDDSTVRGIKRELQSHAKNCIYLPSLVPIKSTDTSRNIESRAFPTHPASLGPFLPY